MPTSSARPAAVATSAALALGSVLIAAPASAETVVPRPERFTSAWTVSATPDTIIDSSGAPVAGQQGASGTFDLLLNSREDVVCWDMDLQGVQGQLQGPAKTGVTLLEAPADFDGPARIAVPDPTGDDASRTGSGCAKGPFTTGVEGAGGADSGDGFRLADIEADPAAYSVEVSTADFPQGAIRGQVVRVPLGGLDTGEGGLAEAAGPSATRLGLGAVALGGVVLAAVAGLRRSRAEV